MNENDSRSAAGPDLNCSEQWISFILRSGVGTSLILMLIGVIACFWSHPQYLSSNSELTKLISPDANFPHTLPDVFHQLFNGRGPAIISVGLLLLIATPIARIAISIVGFLNGRDYVFAVITSFVLLIVLLSFLLGKIQ